MPNEIDTLWGHLDVASYLVAKGAGINLKDDEGITPASVTVHGYRSNQVTGETREPVRDYLNTLHWK